MRCKKLMVLLVMACMLGSLWAGTETVNMFGMTITTSDDHVWPTKQLSDIGYGKIKAPRNGSVEEYVLYVMDGASWMVLIYDFPSNTLAQTKEYAKSVYSSGYCYRTSGETVEKVDMKYMVVEIEGAYLFSAYDSSGKPAVVSYSGDEDQMLLMLGNSLF